MAKFPATIGVTHINIRQSISFLLLKLIFLDILAVVIAILFFSTLATALVPDAVKLTIISYNMGYFFILVGVKIVLTIFIVLQWVNEYYEIFPSEIVYREGIIWRKEQRWAYREIEYIRVEQGLLGKMFNFGSLTLYDWKRHQFGTLYLIHNPLKNFRILESLLPNVSKERQIVREHLIEKEDD